MQTESGFIDVPGGRLYYEIEGSGPPLLLIHGGLGSLRMWDEQLPAFAEHYRVTRYDARGYGRTETDDVPFSNRADAAAVLAHVGAASCHLVGQSRGGNIALDLTLERPELVASLVSVAGGVGGYEPELPEGVEAPPWDEMERLWEAKEWPTLAELDTRVWVDGWGQPQDRVSPALRRRVHDWILDSYRAERNEGQPQPLDPPAVGRLKEVSVPVLVVMGTADEPGSLLTSRRLAEGVAGARLEEFAGVAHMVHLEEPDRFNRLVLEFLAGVDSRG
ncbi:MAG TPA: alpha/beta hydrolase [Candidatus Limnocylindria bacterium]|nr:alpha/beta hydrolase [Candidatus Limnocylindria bacterium]